MLWRKRPNQPSARLNFNAGVIIVFKLRSHRKVQPIRRQLDLVLRKPAKEVVRAIGRQETESRDGFRFPGRRTITRAPYELLCVRDRKVVLEVDVEGVARFLK